MSVERQRVCNPNLYKSIKKNFVDRHFLQTGVCNTPSFLQNPKNSHKGKLTFLYVCKVSSIHLSSPLKLFGYTLF